MGKRSQLARAIEETEAEIGILQQVLARLRQQQDQQKPPKSRRVRPETASPRAS